MTVTRLALGLEYGGTRYCGWERQRHCASVQEVLERALSHVADHDIATVCAGRTDSGVHALAQVVHFETRAARPARAWVLGTNANLPRDVGVGWAVAVDERFHARFSALGRSYTYLVLNRRARPALLHGRVAWERRPLDVDRMRDAARALVGEHDFSAYRASGCQARSPVRHVYAISVARHGELVRLDIAANAFLQHMVRNIAGVLLAIGAGERPPQWAGEVLASRDRTAGGVTASPDGLYLMGVRYPQAYRLPSNRFADSGLSAVCPLLGLWYPAQPAGAEGPQ